MLIHPFLANQSFDPDVIGEMSAALDEVCKALGLSVVDDPATRLIARKIIELAQRGVRDAATLSAHALRELNGD
jgi:hypothetical protein